MRVRPVVSKVVPNPTVTYQVNNGRAEVVGAAGGRGGSVPISGASISLVGGGVLRLGVGDIEITGRNNETIIWKSVPNAKAVRDQLERLSRGDNTSSTTVRSDRSTTTETSAKGLRLVRQLKTARFMGPRHPVDKVLTDIFKPDAENESMCIRNFDWDGSHSVVRPCDVHLAIDRWDLSNGNHTDHAEVSDESWATMYAISLSSGAIFGNGSTVAFKPDFEGLEIIDVGDTNIVNGFAVSRDRKVCCFVENEGKSAVFLEAVGTDGIKIRKLSTAKHFESYVSARMYFNPHIRRPNEVFAFQYQSSQEDYPPHTLLRIGYPDLSRGGKKRKINGLQNIALSHDGKILSVITTTSLIHLDAISLQGAGAEQPFGLAREKEHYVVPPIQYSPCGRFLAYSYALDGTVIVCDARNFKPIAELAPQGLPASIFEWSPDGHYLAAAFRSRNDGESRLVIWKDNKPDPVVELSDVKIQDSSHLHSVFPKTFYWHPSRNEFLVLTTNGRISRYQIA